MARIALLGGTGPEGSGLALRFALAGEDIIIASRDRQRAEDAAQRLIDILPTAPTGRVDALDNAAAVIAAEVVALAVPFNALEPLLATLGESFARRMVLDVVNPLVLRAGTFHVLPVADGSVGQLVQRLLPNSQVVCGFKHLSAKELFNLDRTLDGDVLLCGDAPEALGFFVKLIACIPRLRAVEAGGLSSAAHLESITAVLLNLNRRYKTNTSLKILGLRP